MTTILLADDHDVVRFGLRYLLESHPDLRVCGEAQTGREAVALAGQLQPDVAILDLGMPDLNGIEATRRIRQLTPSTEVLIFSIYETEYLVREAIVAGARGYLVKGDAAQQLVPAVKALAVHKPFFSSVISQTILKGLRREGPVESDQVSPISALTSREREVLQLLAEGNGNSQIAEQLGISVKTVETHRGAIMRKLKLNSVVELVHFAIRHGIVFAPSSADIEIAKQREWEPQQDSELDSGG